MFHAALLAMMNTTFAPCRFALSISIALMPNAPSPLTTTTCRPGYSKAAAMPYGTPTPRQPNVPASRYVRGASRPSRAKLRMSPPSAIVIASGRKHLAQRREDAVGMHVAVVARRRLGELSRRTSRAAHVLAAQRLRPLGIDARRRPAECGSERGKRQAGCANNSTSPRRFSRSSSQLSAMRIQRAFGRTAGDP